MSTDINMLRYEEIKYAYAQSQQLSMQTGCAGSLRADFGKDEGFFSSWSDICPFFNTDEFKAVLDSLMEELRGKGRPLHDRKTLSSFCYENSDSRIGENEFGFRTDKDGYTFLMRLNPRRGEYNLYCYCYNSRWLNEHISEASRGIRFITPDYRDRFRLPDGEKIIVSSADGTKTEHTCRYIDETHLEVGRNLFHICEYAERLEDCGKTCEPKDSPLPQCCYSADPESGRLILIKRYEPGFTFADDVHDFDTSRETADAANETLGVSKRQAAAMNAGALKGWCSPAADPNRYDENGVFIRKRDMER